MKAKIYNVNINGADFTASSFENKKEFVTMYSRACDFYAPLLSQGEVRYLKKSESINDSISFLHPNSTAVESKLDVGVIKEKVWRPGLSVEFDKALDIGLDEFNRSKRELRILIEKLKEILLYIEPCSSSMSTYGHKLRELLILTCTAIESAWLSYLKTSAPQIKRATTNDYVKLKDILLLDIYKINFVSHPFLIEFKPFESWSASNPTKTLSWYDAYNKTKHDSLLNFNQSSLENCIHSIGALIVMQCVRFSPYKVLQGQELTAQLINEHFTLEIDNSRLEDFYVPSIKSYSMASGAFSAPMGSTFDSNWSAVPWTI